jgi:ADP-heptose:LPS heptosyltransferase
MTAMERTPAIDEIDRLLIVKTSSIGDVIHALPVIEAIKKARPSLYIGWVVRRRCSGILEGNPWVDIVHVVPDKPSMADLGQIRKDLVAQQYACALEMQGLFLSGLIAKLSGAPIRIGIDRNREMNTLFLTHAVVPGKPAVKDGPDRHAVDILYGFADVLGVHVEHPEFAEQPYLTQPIDPQADYAGCQVLESF